MAESLLKPMLRRVSSATGSGLTCGNTLWLCPHVCAGSPARKTLAEHSGVALYRSAQVFSMVVGLLGRQYRVFQTQTSSTQRKEQQVAIQG